MHVFMQTIYQSKMSTQVRNYFDNGSSVVGAEREITTAIEDWNQKQIQDELLQYGIPCRWVFQPG